MLASRWIESKVGYIANYVNGYPFKPGDWSDDGRPIIRIETLTKRRDSGNRYQKMLDDRYSIGPGDIIISWSGSLGVYIWDRNEQGWLNQHLFKVSPDPRQVDRAFFTLLASHFLRDMSESTHGSTLQHITRPKFNSHPVLLPPLDEQRAIARFLDRKSRRIAGFIRARQRMIALLNEQKQAIIHHAVTRGLDPDVPLKPSGIDWLGDIPVHWSLVPSGRAMAEIGQGWSPVAGDENESGDQWSVLTLSAVKRGKFSPEACKPIALALTPRPELELKVGDLLMTRANTRLLVGDVAIVDSVPPRLIFSDLIYRIRMDRQLITPAYFALLMRSPYGRILIEREARASNETMVKLAASRIRQWPLPTPTIVEQEDIVRSCAEALAKLQATVELHSREIELLREYRTRLIADVVTGRLDIRDHPDAAEDAPDDDDETGLLDTLAMGDDTGDDPDAGDTEDANEPPSSASPG